MYITNRKHGYKVKKFYKTKSIVILINQYGATWKCTIEKLEQCGYKFTKNKPVNLH